MKQTDPKNLHYYRIEMFYEVIDLQHQELNNRFNDVNIKVICCV